MRMIFLTALMVCMSFLILHAQPVLKATVDKSEILIGDQFRLKMELEGIEPGSRINMPVIPDSLQHFEVVNRSKIDSLYSNDQLKGVAQTFTFTSFDSGKWVLPSFLLTVNPPKDDTTYNFFTDSAPITVSFSTSDTTNQVRDIKPIMEADSFNPIWYWIGAGVLVAALIIFLVWFYRYWKKNKGTVPYKSKTSIYDEAMKDLDALKEYNLSDSKELKIVHTRLGEILKQYLSGSQKANYSNKTTSDVLVLIGEQETDKELLSKVASSLRCGDAVKFAKYFPPSGESEASIQAIKELIKNMHQNKSSAQQLSTTNLKS